MALSITVHGQGTFTASMEEGPVTFTASIGSVGPQGATGATGPSGVVSATAPITYNSGTQTIGISATPTFTSVTATTGNITTVNLTTATFADATSQTTAFVGEARKGYIIARNNTGSTIAAGKVVYLSGATGNKPTVALALATSDATSARTIGLTSESIANNADGKVIISGACENIDTSAFSAGDIVYLSASTAGGMVTTMPSAPQHGVVIGIVTRANPSVGSVEVAINNYQELAELSDVSVADRANNDGLFWESSSSTWRSKTIAEVLGLTPISLSSLSASAPISYNSTTGAFTFDSSTYLLKADNLSGLASASTARTNLGLGTMAVETAANYLTSATASTTYQTQAGMSSYLTTSAASSTYQTQAGMSSYALLASPTFTGDPKAPTPATSDNDTSIATTAFVNAYCPTASTSTAGKVQLATDAQAVAATSTTLGITPANLEAQSFDQDFQSYEYNAWTATTSGTGASTAQTLNAKFVAAPTSATGYGLLSQGLYAAVRGGNANAGFAWGKRYAASFRIVNVGASADANSVGRVLFGKGNAVTTTGLSTRGFGIQLTVGGTLQILAHDGTTLTTYNTSHTFAATTAIDVTLTLSSAGTVTCYVNGSSVGSTTGGPTSSVVTAGNAIHLEAENTATLSGARLQLIIQNPRLHVAVS